MRKISKKISLEPLKSRVPSLAPYYLENGVKATTSLSGATWNHTLSGNYGYIPLNILAPDGKTDLSWSTISEMRHFFQEYTALLHSFDGCTMTPLKSAMEYYENNVKKYDEYGFLIKKYQDLDMNFANYGGFEMYKFICEKCYNEVVIPWGGDFEYENVHYTLPYDLYNEWGCITMFIPVVIQWLGWFKLRYDKYHHLTDCNGTTDCCDCSAYLRKGGNIMYYWLMSLEIQDWDDSNIEICDEKSSISIPINLINTIDDLGVMDNMAEEWEGGENYQNTFYGSDNKLGTVVSFMDDDWVIKDNYSGTTYNDEHKEMIFGNYVYDNEIKDYVESSNKQWVRRIHKTIDSDVKNINTTYTIKNDKYIDRPINVYDTYPITQTNGFVVINGQSYLIEKRYSVIYKVNTLNAALKRLNGQEFAVEFLANGLPYTIINGKKHIGYKKNNGGFFFNFSSVPCNKKYLNTSECAVIEKECVVVDDKIYNVVVENQMKYVKVIERNIYVTYYKVLYEYVNINNTQYFIENNTIVTQFNSDIENDSKPNTYQKWSMGDLLEKTKEYQLNKRQSFWKEFEDSTIGHKLTEQDVINENTHGYKIVMNSSNLKVLQLYTPYTIFDKRYVYGKTESKLSSLLRIDIAMDGLGKEIPGTFLRESLDTTTDDGFLFEDEQTKVVQYGARPYIKPTQDSEWIDLYYQVGTVSDIDILNDTYSVDNNGSEEERGLYWGNLLRSIEFYYLDYDGKKIEATRVKITTDASNHDKLIFNQNDKINGEYITNILASQLSKGAYSVLMDANYEEENILPSNYKSYLETKVKGTVFGGEQMYCEIKYHIGAILIRRRDELNEQVTYDISNDFHEGVEYTDTFTVSENECIYYINETDFLILKHLKLQQSMKDVDMGDYNKTIIQVPISEFKVRINLWYEDCLEQDTYGNCLKKTIDDHIFTNNKTSDATFDAYNGMTDFPLIRKDWCIGFTGLENKTHDIYIDRGVAQAYDMHLKLGEIKSFEALENYGNGYFRIERS